MAKVIISIIVIALAIGQAFYLRYRKIKRRRMAKATVVQAIAPETKKTVCDECLAECVLRDAPESFREENALLCERSLEEVKCS